ncbi:DUF2946 family protein [Lacisediminimonas profundi]|uniref:DUF2946 family protein n=1 Tax=Lacisediminimonas profundi TaxID=2603856 RepID=UPI00124B5C89|nr:DUF2946 family protein [Lacisediminimonas profundi]
MDEIVRQAMAKWPDVPHCFGWLALDARGHWRMRDDRAQALGLPGDRIRNTTLIGFINRNYLPDEQGRWYFQNGPQRVYVDLEICPFVCHTDPALGLVLHTGEPLAQPESVMLSAEGDLAFGIGKRCAVLDDRDLDQGLARLRLEDAVLDEETLVAWLDGEDRRPLTFDWKGRALPVQRVTRAELAGRFGFVSHPRQAA